MRDMTHEQGGFFAAEDADSYPHEGADHKEEGAFYVWTWNEIEKIIWRRRSDICCFYSARREGNAPEQGDPHGEFKARIFFTWRQRVNKSQPIWEERKRIEEILTRSRESCFAVRAKRPRPHRDEKLSWRGTA
jgi:uncharacterized protein YyaL (SSP411 family)